MRTSTAWESTNSDQITDDGEDEAFKELKCFNFEANFKKTLKNK